MPQFSNITIADIDKTIPNIENVIYENETWEVVKQAKILANDNIRIYAWGINKNPNGILDEEWKVLEGITPNLDVTTEITENGTHYIWVKDSAGNILNRSIQVDKVDNIPPEISYTINQETLSSGYVTINVTAVDNESGLYSDPYSWNGTTWSQENSTRVINQNGRYKVYAIDNLGNMSEKEIVIDVFPQEGTATLGEGNIIESIYVSADWNENINNNVQIKLNKDLKIKGWQITQSVYSPNAYVEVNTRPNPEPNNTAQNIPNEQPNNVNNATNTQANTTNTQVQEPTQNTEFEYEQVTVTTTLSADTTYFVWVKDADGNIGYQTFVISKAQI